ASPTAPSGRQGVHPACRLAPATTDREIFTELLDANARDGRCDVMSDVAEPFPTPVICALLGAPREDWELISDWSDDIKKFLDWNLVADGAVILNAWRALDDYLEEMITRRRHTLTDDLISTRHQLAAAVDIFCDHPDQWALLGEHPELVPRAAEETMRYRPIGFALPRITTEDVDLAGVRIRARTIVLANTAAANRDPSAFGDPDRFDMMRDNTVGTLSFGSGAHYCLGSHLARLELTPHALTG